MKIIAFRPDEPHGWIYRFWLPLWNLSKTDQIYMKIIDFRPDGPMAGFVDSGALSGTYQNR